MRLWQPLFYNLGDNHYKFSCKSWLIQAETEQEAIDIARKAMVKPSTMLLMPNKYATPSDFAGVQEFSFENGIALI
jgi:hypothetical protein